MLSKYLLESLYLSSQIGYEAADTATHKAYYKSKMEEYLYSIRQMEKDEHMSEIRKAAEEYDV